MCFSWYTKFWIVLTVNEINTFSHDGNLIPSFTRPLKRGILSFKR